MEMYPSGGKAAYLHEVQRAANRFAEIQSLLDTIRRVYDDRRYGPEMPNEITEEECQAMGFTQNDLSLFINFCGQLADFMAGKPIFAIDHNPIISTLRTDL